MIMSNDHDHYIDWNNTCWIFMWTCTRTAGSACNWGRVSLLAKSSWGRVSTQITRAFGLYGCVITASVRTQVSSCWRPRVSGMCSNARWWSTMCKSAFAILVVVSLICVSWISASVVAATRAIPVDGHNLWMAARCWIPRMHWAVLAKTVVTGRASHSSTW